MSLLTTADRVRNRMGFTTADLTDTIIEEFITDQQAFVEDTLDKTFSRGDDGFELARSVVTDLAAMIALVRLTGGTTSGLDYKIGKLDVEKGGQLEDRLRVIFELKVRAREGLALLQRDARKHKAVWAAVLHTGPGMHLVRPTGATLRRDLRRERSHPHGRSDPR